MTTSPYGQVPGSYLQERNYSPNEQDEDQKPLFLTIPYNYVAGLSEGIQRVCKEFNIKQEFIVYTDNFYSSQSYLRN